MVLKNYGLVSVTRKLGAHYIEKVGDVNYLTDDVLAICLPFGNTLEDCIKMKFFNSKYYFSIVRILSDNEGLGLICAFDSIGEIMHNQFLPIIEILNILKIKTGYDSKLTTEILKLYPNKNILLEIENIQCTIISLLLNKKVFILDDNFQIFSLILSLIELFPEKFHSLFDFTINSTSFTENINIMSFQYYKELDNQLEDLNKEKSTIIDMEHKICFGIFSSPLLNELIKKLKNNETEKANSLILILEKLIFDITNVTLKSSEFGKKYKITKTDAKLIDLIRLNLLKIPPKQNIFEELIK